MSGAESDDTTERFAIEVPDDNDTPLSSGDSVIHKDHGALDVDKISIGRSGKRATFRLVSTPNISISYSDEEIREMWGDSMIGPVEHGGSGAEDDAE